MTPEERARQQIEAQLAASGWVVQDYKAVDRAAGRGIALREVPLTTGPCDYLLLVDRKALGVLEAKKERTILSTVADQSARYANGLLEYFDASLIGLTATPAPQTIAYFHQNRVAEYNHERAVTDGVNVGYDVYRIKTRVTRLRQSILQKAFTGKLTAQASA